ARSAPEPTARPSVTLPPPRRAAGHRPCAARAGAPTRRACAGGGPTPGGGSHRPIAGSRPAGGDTLRASGRRATTCGTRRRAGGPDTSLRPCAAVSFLPRFPSRRNPVRLVYSVTFTAAAPTLPTGGPADGASRHDAGGAGQHHLE